MMKNYEKYADAIREYKGDSFCADFVKPNILKSEYCDLDCTRCRMLQALWLLEDYKEPEVDWSKVEVDTIILVKSSEKGDWLKRHFAKYENGEVYAWDNGHTSNESSCMVYCKYAKLAESDGAE